MLIYVVVKGAKEEMGDFIAVSVEAAFDSEEKARNYFKDKLTVWKETIQGAICDCERSVQIVELN